MSVSPASDSHRAGPTIDYRGNGAQTAHLGEGDQNINASQGVQNIVGAEGQLVQNFYQPAGTASLELASSRFEIWNQG